jgi:uncharacterized protein with FMN-binding domain
MRRATLALLGTTIGTSLLIGAKVGTPTPAGVQDVAVDTADGAVPGDATDPATGPSAATPAAAASRTGAPSTAPTRTAAAKATSPVRTGTTPATPRRTTAAPRPTTPTTGLGNGTFTGGASTNQYGTITVTITVSGGKVTDVAASYPTSPSRTASINSNAIPKLRQEALAAQSAKIATVSGATYTSGSYKTSLQSALDKAKA